MYLNFGPRVISKTCESDSCKSRVTCTFCLLSASPIAFLGTQSNAFSRSTKTWYSFFFFSLNFSCNCLMTKIASVVDLPGLKPKCQQSTFINFLSLSSNTFSNSFIPCSNNRTPLYFPHSRASPFSL